ncbi:hypothetical protein Tco_1005370 [Tanacetum coccineum]|uniref:Uncharacterized protein n=1 Tax=Tanacetum coccineum TaxID=301880 RepID=A0ABQ5FH04_9ASTR
MAIITIRYLSVSKSRLLKWQSSSKDLVISTLKLGISDKCGVGLAQNGLGGYDWSNDFDEPVNYALMAFSSSSSSSSSDNKVQNYSKQCLESFKTLQKNFDSEREKHSKAKLEIQGYELALESLESRILRHEKNELAWGEKYEFQNYKLKYREVKIDNLKIELEKIVKERDELKVKIEKWEESSKGLNKILNSQMSAKDKNGLDEYAIRKKIIESQTTELNTDTSKSKTSESVSKTNKVEKSNPKINRDKVIIEDWNSDDEDDVSEKEFDAVVNTGKGKMINDLKKSRAIQRSVYRSCCGWVRWLSSHMTGNKAYLSDYEDYNRGFVAFGSDPKGVVLRAPRQNGVYSLDLKNIVPSGGKPPSISFMRPFGCPLTILNTLDSLSKFDEKSDEGYLLGYSTTNQPNVAGSGPDWMFDLDFLTNTMNYIPVSVENQVNVDAGTQEHYVAGSLEKDKEPTQEYILLPLHPHRLRISVEDIVQVAQEKPSKNSPKDTNVQDSEDVAENEEQHMLTEADQALQDDLKRMITQEIVTKTMDDATRQALEEEKKRAA